MLRLYKNLKSYAWMVIIVLLMVVLQSMGDLYLPTLMSDIINEGVMMGDTSKIFQIGLKMILVAFISVCCAVIASYFSSRSAMGLGKTIREKLFHRIESYSLNEFDKFGTATLITRTTNDVTQIQTVTVMIMRMMISAPIMCVGGTYMAMRKDKPLTLVLAVAIPMLAGVIAIIASKMIPRFKLVQIKIDRINLVLREKLTGIRVIRAFDTVEKERIRFAEANEDLTDNYIKVNKIMAFMMPSIMLVMNLTSLSVIWFGGIRISEGNMDLGALSAFTQYVMQIMFSLVMLSVMFIMVPRAQAAAVRINEVLDTEPEIVDPEEIQNGTDKGYVEFKNVTFSYNGAAEPALKNISFSARPGETTAIIGSTGSGKSALIQLIPRFYDIDEGEVLIDGVDVREMSQKELRSKIGFVPQKAILFSGTISENIRFGNENATDEEVISACQTAQAESFINELEGKYDYMISQGGTNVSGGQKQRLSIARALARKAEIYIFDDSFSALDFKTDAMLRAALREETKESTVIIVAQRVGTVMDADRIIVLDDGEIAGMGTHSELMKNCEVYQQIVESQLSAEEIA